MRKKYKINVEIDLEQLSRDIKKGIEAKFPDMPENIARAFTSIGLYADIGPFYTSKEHKQTAFYNALRDYTIGRVSARIREAQKEVGRNSAKKK